MFICLSVSYLNKIGLVKKWRLNHFGKTILVPSYINKLSNSICHICLNLERIVDQYCKYLIQRWLLIPEVVHTLVYCHTVIQDISLSHNASFTTSSMCLRPCSFCSFTCSVCSVSKADGLFNKLRRRNHYNSCGSSVTVFCLTCGIGAFGRFLTASGRSPLLLVYNALIKSSCGI